MNENRIYEPRRFRFTEDWGLQQRKEFGDQVAAALSQRIQKVIKQIFHAPEHAPRIEQRTDMRVLPLVRYPFKVFYRIISDDTVRILHIRHTARRPWTADDNV